MDESSSCGNGLRVRPWRSPPTVPRPVASIAIFSSFLSLFSPSSTSLVLLYRCLHYPLAVHISLFHSLTRCSLSPRLFLCSFSTAFSTVLNGEKKRSRIFG